MKRPLALLAIVAAALTGCVSPPIVSLSDADPSTLVPPANLERLATLPSKSLLDDYHRATIELVPSDENISLEGPTPAKTPPPPPESPAVIPIEALPIEMPRVAFRQAVLEPIEPATSPQGMKLFRTKPIQEISLDITPPSLVNEQDQPIALPQNEGAAALPTLAQDRPFTRGDLVAAGYEWHPSPDGLNFCYQPLFFEEVNLERYGRSYGILQPGVSAAAFFGRIPLIPYMAFARPARRCTMHAHWTLPGYKIGRWEPQPIVPSIHGGAAEVAVLYGIILLIP